MNGKSQAFLIKIIQLHVRKKSETEFKNPKRPLKISNIRNNSKREPIETFNRFDCLSGEESLNEIPEANDSNEKTVSRNKIRISDVQVKNKFNWRFHPRKGNQRIGKSTKKLTELIGDSIIKMQKAGRSSIGKINLLCDTFLVRRLTTWKHASFQQLNRIRKQ